MFSVLSDLICASFCHRLIFVTKCCSLLSYQVYFRDIFRSVPYNIKLDDSFIHIKSQKVCRSAGDAALHFLTLWKKIQGRK